MTATHDILQRLFANPPWMANAPCAGLTDTFYPDPHEPGRPAEQAKTICATCDHRVQCLEYALDNRERYGIWGGTSEGERRKIVQRRKEMGWETGQATNQPRHGTDAGIRWHRRDIDNRPMCDACQWLIDDRNRTSPFETTVDRRARLRREAS